MEATTEGVGPIRMTRLASWLIAQISAHAGRLVGDGFAAIGARGYHFRILATLDEQGPASQAVLARRSGIHPTDIVGALDELVGQRLVQRETDPADRRRNIITLTGTGRTRLAELDAQIEKVQDELLAPLPERDRDELRRILIELLEHHNAASAAAQ